MGLEITERKCSACEETKPITEYRQLPFRIDAEGVIDNNRYDKRCKDCVRKQQSAGYARRRHNVVMDIMGGTCKSCKNTFEDAKSLCIVAKVPWAPSGWKAQFTCMETNVDWDVYFDLYCRNCVHSDKVEKPEFKPRYLRDAPSSES